MTYDPEHSTPESPDMLLTRELFNVIDHVALLVDFLETSEIPVVTHTELLFDWRSLDEAIFPAIVRETIESGFCLTDVTVQAAMRIEQDHYALTVEFVLTHDEVTPVHITMKLPPHIVTESVRTGQRHEGSDQVINDSIPVAELNVFFYSLVIDQNEIYRNYDEIIARDINAAYEFSTLLTYLKRVSFSTSITKDYEQPTSAEGILEVRSDEYSEVPDTRVVQAFVTVRLHPTTDQAPVYASIYIDFNLNNPVELYLYFKQEDKHTRKSIVRVPADDPRIHDVLEVIRAAAAATPRGMDYFISNVALDALYDDPKD